MTKKKVKIKDGKIEIFDYSCNLTENDDFDCSEVEPLEGETILSQKPIIEDSFEVCKVNLEKDSNCNLSSISTNKEVRCSISVGKELKDCF